MILTPQKIVWNIGIAGFAEDVARMSERGWAVVPGTLFCHQEGTSHIYGICMQVEQSMSDGAIANIEMLVAAAQPI